MAMSKRQEIEAWLSEKKYKRAQRDLRLAPFEKHSSRGAILIDGHHVFLDLLREIRLFNDDVIRRQERAVADRKISREELKSLNSDLPNIWAKANPVDFADFLNEWIVWVLGEHLPKLEYSLRGGKKIPLSAREILQSPMLNPKEVCLIDNDPDVWIFDAYMPDKVQLRARLAQRIEEGKRWNAPRYEIDRMKHALASVDSNKWEFWAGNGLNISTDYDFKDRVLDRIQDDEVGWRVGLGLRQIRISKNAQVISKEKAVDTRFVITGCDCASDPQVSWVCLVTNDADYVPVVERLLENKKSVFWLPMDEDRSRSRELANVIRPNMLVEKDQLFRQFKKHNSPKPTAQTTRYGGSAGLALFAASTMRGAERMALEHYSGPLAEEYFLDGFLRVVEDLKKGKPSA
jgi:uncharacterized LabA/DUF88 family protein